MIREAAVLVRNFICLHELHNFPLLNSVRKATNFFPTLSHNRFFVPSNPVLARKIDDAAVRLLNKFLRVDSFNVSDYTQRYLQNNLRSNSKLFFYSQVLYHILDNQNQDENVFLEYGGGTGMLSLLALEVGLKQVYYNDIFPQSAVDAKEIADRLGYLRSGYITGSIEEVQRYCRETGVTFSGIGSYDVIEHIYDLKDFYLKLPSVLTKDGVVSMMTGANTYNRAIVDSLAKRHEQIERHDRAEQWGRKETDKTQAYYNLRLQVIKEKLAGTEVDESMIEKLAETTIGLRREDIDRAVESFLAYGTLPCPDKRFPTNTCDPYTGNWAEHLIDFDDLQTFLQNNGYRDIHCLFNGSKEHSKNLLLLCKQNNRSKPQ